jgi:hypothetical protein
MCAVSAVSAVSAVHEQVKERTGEQQKEKTGSQHMGAMLCEQQKSPNRQQHYKANASPRRQEVAFCLLFRACMVMMRHVTLSSRTSSFALEPAPNSCERSSRKHCLLAATPIPAPNGERFDLD